MINCDIEGDTKTISYNIQPTCGKRNKNQQKNDFLL